MKKLSFVILVIFIQLAIAADSMPANDIYAEYCFIKEGKNNMKLKLSREIKKIKPISIAKTDSVKCEVDPCGFGRTKTLFNIPSTEEQVLPLWGCISSSFRSIIKTKIDPLDSTKFHCTTEYIFDGAIMENYSSLIDIEFPEEKNFVSENSQSLSLEDMQKFVGKDILAEWDREVKCKPSIDTTYSGSYFIRITGECK